MQNSDLSSTWFDRANGFLTEAQSSFRTERHAWACILAEQAAEKALIALYAGQGQEPWGCNVSQLLRGLPPDLTIPEDLVEKGQALDSCSTCGGGAGHGSYSPCEWWGSEQSKLAIQCARDTVEFVRPCLDPQPLGGSY